MQLRGKGAQRGGISANNGLTCLLVPVTLYSIQALKKNHFVLLWQEATKTIVANKDNSCDSLLCTVVISQYSNKVDVISMSEAQMGVKGGPVPTQTGGMA